MKTETKAEMLRYILLQESRLYDNVLFTLLSTRSLMNELERIDERTFSFDIEPAAGMFNMNYRNYETLKAKIIDILYNRYRLRVTSEDPLNFEKVS